MADLIGDLRTMLSPPVLLYLTSVLVLQLLVPFAFRCYEFLIDERRREAGLPRDVLLNAGEQLAYLRVQATSQSLVFLGSVLVVPLVLVRYWPDQQEGLAITFVALLLWLLVSGSDVAKSFIGGLFFKTLVSFSRGVQVGDRVTLRDQSGRVTRIGIFFVTINTLDDDLVNIPTSSLWQEVLISANAGDRSSLCVMNFYLAPFATHAQRQQAEDVIWDAIQASPYCEISKPMQIYLTQEINSIRLTARAYVTSTYKEPLFKSDVTRAFLEAADAERIPLAWTGVVAAATPPPNPSHPDPKPGHASVPVASAPGDERKVKRVEAMSQANADLRLPHKLCFIDMPFGTKIDPKTGIEIQCDQIYEAAIRPAVEAAGLSCIRGDEERTGGIIHKAMFARLLLCDFVIADMTTANPNVFYELGVRHAAKPYTTIPIFATIGSPPFDVGFVRAIPYTLDDGRISDEAARVLQDRIVARIQSALQGPVAQDSPLFELFSGFPGIEISHELTDVFRERVEYSARFRDSLAEARQVLPLEDAIKRLQEIATGLGDLQAIERGVLVDLFLSYRDVSAWDQMIDLYDKFPADVKDAVICRQQLAFALNRRNTTTDRDKAIAVLEKLLKEHGASAETYGLLGRARKDRYQDAKKAGSPEAQVYLDQAIDAYRKGFEAEPADYYPGVNAVSLLLLKGDEESLQQVDYLTPLVSFAVARRGGLNSTDYWDLATVLELALIGRDDALAERALPAVLAAASAAKASWMPKTTADNLAMVLELRKETEDIGLLEQSVAKLRHKQQELGDDG